MSAPDDSELTAAALENDDVLAARLDLVASALDGPVQAGAFTDEELAALDDLTLSPIQPSPWYESLTDTQKQLVMSAALRSLTARGVYRAEPVAEHHTLQPAVDPFVLAILTMRRYVPYLVVVERATADFTDWALLYPQRGETFLIEYVDRIGLHEFVAVDSETAVEAMIEWSGGNLEPSEPTDMLDVSLTTEQIAARPAVLEPLTRSLFSSTATRFDPARPDEESWTAVHAGGPSGIFACAPDGELVRYRSLRRDELHAWWELTVQ